MNINEINIGSIVITSMSVESTVPNDYFQVGMVIGDQLVGKYLDNGSIGQSAEAIIKVSDVLEVSSMEGYEADKASVARWIAAETEANRKRVAEVVEATSKGQTEEFGNTIILSVGFRSMGCTKALNEAEKTMVRQQRTEKLKMTKTLFKCEEYDKLKSFTTAAQTKLKSFGIAFPLASGMTLLRVNLIPKVEAEIAKIQATYWPLVDAFVAKYPEVITPEATGLDYLHNPANYRSPAEVKQAYGFTTRWMHFGAPESLKAISEEFFAMEQARTVAVWAEAKELGLATLRKDMADMADRLVNSLTNKEDGKRPKFYDSAVTDLQGFFAEFENRNLAGDAELSATVEKMKAIFANVSLDRLKSADRNVPYRDKVKVAAEQLQAVAATLVKTSTRKFDLQD